MSEPTSSSNHASWLAIAVLAAAVALLEWQSPLPVAPASLVALAIACTTLGTVALFYSRVRREDQFAAMSIALMQVLLFSALGAILSYLVARGHAPLWDERLTRWDHALGLDWMTFMRWVDAHAWTAAPLRFAYASLIPQIIVLVVVLGFTRRLDQLRAVMFAAIACGIVVVLLSGMFPAIGNFAFLNISSADFRHIDPWAATVHMPHYTALRDGTLAIIRLNEMKGIITFPSYHAGLSMVTLWGFWLAPVAIVRWPGMLLAVLTIVATPVDGGHYFVDVFAGMAIAAASIAVARRAVSWTPAWPRLTASPFRRSHAVSGR